jgi:hypothetical protein
MMLINSRLVGFGKLPLFEFLPRTINGDSGHTLPKSFKLDQAPPFSIYPHAHITQHQQRHGDAAHLQLAPGERQNHWPFREVPSSYGF